MITFAATDPGSLTSDHCPALALSPGAAGHCNYQTPATLPITLHYTLHITCYKCYCYNLQGHGPTRIRPGNDLFLEASFNKRGERFLVRCFSLLHNLRY